MINYNPLWKTMKKKDITQYRLNKEFDISRGQISRLKHNYNVSTHTLNRLCEILDCGLEDVVEYTKTATENPDNS